MAPDELRTSVAAPVLRAERPIRGTELTSIPRHSGLGVASFVCWTIGAVTLLVLLVFCIVTETRKPGVFDDEKSAAFAILALTLLAAIFLFIVGAVLAIGGFFQTDRQNLSAVLGLIVNGLSAVGLLGLLVAGIISEIGPVGP